MDAAPRIAAYDLETRLKRQGQVAPKIVCGAVAEVGPDGRSVGRFFAGEREAVAEAWRLFSATATGLIIAGANIAYDLACLAAADRALLREIFRALRQGSVHDDLIAQALDAIYRGTLGKDPRTGDDLRVPSSGRVSKSYSLEVVTEIVLGRSDAKARDDWRLSYALLEGLPPERWPVNARQYPIDDVVNTRDVAVVQTGGQAGSHWWVPLPRLPGDASFLDWMQCAHGCGARWDSAPWTLPADLCPRAPRVQYQNLGNLAAQVEFAFAAQLGACRSLRTDPERVEALAADVDEKYAVWVERFQQKGWVRDDGSENQAAIKRAVAAAYGATAPCRRCKGRGKIQRATWVDCKGEKVRGRYRGCQGTDCTACAGDGKVVQFGNEVNCRNVFDERGALAEEGCDGTGFDLGQVPTLPRTDKLGVKTERDTLMESGDDDLADYGDDEWAKSRSTYVPYLRRGIVAPLPFSVDVLKETGRCSIYGSCLHQMPRHGGERRCIRARGAWCGSPIEYVLGSTDYQAGELCTLAQLCYWLFGYSQMRDAINASGKPGILHSDLAASVLGISLEEFLKRYKAKDRQAVDFRQMCKPIDFGAPGGMGPPKLVFTSRAKKNGFTPCDGGPARDEKGRPGYWGVRFCILMGGSRRCGEEKITEWKGYKCLPVCRKCVEAVAGVLLPAFFKRYPEVKDYHRWVSNKIDRHEPAPTAVWDAQAGRPKIVRERACDEFSAFANNGFQSMLADIGKHAFVRVARECYLGEKDDGSPSPLVGCYLPIYLHDELLSELVLQTSHLSGPRIGDLMEDSGRLLAPDVAWVAKTALAYYLDKEMEERQHPVTGNLIPWDETPERLAA